MENAYNDTDSMDYKLIQNPNGKLKNITLEYNALLGKVIGNPTNDTICLMNDSVCLGNFEFHDYFQFLSVFNETIATEAHTVIGLAPKNKDKNELTTFMRQLKYYWSISG